MSQLSIDAIMNERMAEAIKQKRELGVKEADNFMPYATVVAGNDEVVHLPIGFQNESEKVAKMRLLSDCCEHINAKAVVLMMDTRILKYDDFRDHFHLAKDLDQKAFMVEWKRVMKPYNYYIGNLPRHLWEERLHIVAYGPKVKKLMLTAYEIVGKQIIFGEPVIVNEEETLKVVINMVPAWWN